MIGKNKKYEWVVSKEFEFKEFLDFDKVQIVNERQFIEFLLRNEWVQRKIGIEMKESDGLFPDIQGIIFDEERTPIDVEVEYHAQNYKLHRHPYGKCDLILSFKRKPDERIVSGVPVWSFYKEKHDGLHFTLDSDIHTNWEVIDNEL